MYLFVIQKWHKLINKQIKTYVKKNKKKKKQIRLVLALLWFIEFDIHNFVSLILSF